MSETTKFAMKEALVLTISYEGFGREEHPPFVFYIDTDAEKIAFIDWYLTKLQVMDLFEDAGPFDAFIANFPDGASALYFQCNCHHDEYEKDERVFPLGSDANKLALFELIITGELDIQSIRFNRVSVAPLRKLLGNANIHTVEWYGVRTLWCTSAEGTKVN